MKLRLLIASTIVFALLCGAVPPIILGQAIAQLPTIPARSSGGAAAWGSITGTLSSQSDLQTALDAKAPTATPTFTGVATFSGQYRNGTFVDNGNSGTTDTIDWNAGNVQLSTLTDDVEYTFSNPGTTGRYVLKLVQDGMGGHAVTWPGTVVWPGGVAPTITVTAAAVDICTFLWDGTSYFGACAQDFQ